MKFRQALLITLFTVCLVQFTNCEIRFVFNMFSNGASAPVKEHLNSLNEDIFGERWEDPSLTTPVGLRMQYLLGRRNRVKYDSFISSSFNPLEVQVTAMMMNNTLTSAEAHLQGLFPQGTGPNLSGYQRNVAYPAQGKLGYGTFNQEAFGAPALPYNTQVFPVYGYSDKEYKNFFMYDIKGNCRDLYYEIVDNERNEASRKRLTDFTAAYGDKLALALGLNDKNVFTDYTYVTRLLRNFIAGYTEGKLHKRLTDAGIDLQAFNSTAVDFLNYDLFSVKNMGENRKDHEYLPKITFAIYAEYLLDIMDKRVQFDREGLGYNQDQTHKLILSSVNEVVVASMLKYLEYSLKTKLYYVPYASSLWFELKRPDGKDNTSLTAFDYFVDIIYNDIPLKTVAYSEFRRILEDAWSVTKIRWECSLTPFEFWGYKNATITLGVLLGALQVITLIIFICWKCGGKKHQGFEGKVEV